MVELKRIKGNELISALIQHRIGFLPTFIKYRDKINPVFRNYFDFRKYLKSPNLRMFWIVSDSRRVGQIWIITSSEYASLGRLFVLKRWQNQGIAQEAIAKAEKMFASYKLWRLDTIEQEKNNCHLYEKMGYVKTGHKKIINRRMTIIDYEKRL